jgi:hypothetical protein
MSGGRTFTLPARNEMLKRLRTANNSPHVVEYLYPGILEYAGTDMAAEGIIVMFKSEMMSYCSRFSVDFYRIMEAQLPVFVRALVRDRTVRNQALRLLR